MIKVGTPWIQYKGRFLETMRVDVRKDKFTNYWEYVQRRGHEPNKPDSVSIVAIHPKGLVITKEFRVPINDYELSLPSGLVDPGETAIEAAHRELKEETGLTIEKILRVSRTLYNSAGLINESTVLVYCDVSGEVKPEEGIEVIITNEFSSLVGSMSTKLWLVIESCEYIQLLCK